MKKFFSLLLLAAGVMTVQAAGSSFSYEAINAPLCEAELYLNTYKGLVIDQIGLPVEIQGTDYIEIAKTKGDFDFFINGIVPGLPFGWVQNKFDFEAMDAGFIEFQPGTKFTNPEGLDIVIYPARLIRTPEGVYEIQPFNENKLNSFYEYSVLFKIESDIFTYSNPTYYGEGYAAFYYDNGNYKAFNNLMVTEAQFTPTGKKTFYPPVDSQIEKSQITSLRAMGIYRGQEDVANLQGKIISSVVTDEAIYLNGLFGNTGYSWIKGDIENNTVTFTNGSPLGCTGLFLGAYDVSIKKTSTDYEATLTPMNENIVFEYDLDNNELYGFMNAFTISADETQALVLDNVTSSFSLNNQRWFDVHYNAEIIPWEDVPMTPQEPYSVNSFTGNGGHYVSFEISNISQEGKVMDDNRLFYQLLSNGAPYSFPQTWFGSDFNVEIPYDFYTSPAYFGTVESTVYLNGYFRQLSTPDYLSDVKVELIYYGGGEKISAVSGSGLTGIEEIAANTEIINRDKTVYDIFGRAVNPQNLKPGLYISEGKKFIVR